jgi:polynucleotide 5'-kinase involved in rRNA processing
VGTRWLADRADQQVVSRLVVNTSGFIQGTGAQRLKWAQIELLAPRLILALEREKELQPILIPLIRQHPAAVVRLPLSRRAVSKSVEFRRQYREERFKRYFRNSRRYFFPIDRLAWRGLPLGQGETLALNQRQRLGEDLGTPVLYGEVSASLAVLILKHHPEVRETVGIEAQLAVKNVLWLAAPTIEMRLVGLLDENFIVLALGLILPSAWERQEVTIWSPLPPERREQVRHCRVGRLRLNLHGRELNRV